MLRKAKSWHSSLSRAGKVVLWSIAAVFGSVVIGAASPAPPTPGETKPNTQEEQKHHIIEKKTITETTEIPYEKTTIEDGNLEKGKTQVRTKGVLGVKTITYEVTLENGSQKEKKIMNEAVSTPPTTEVVALGSYVKPQPPRNNCDPNYSPCVPNVSYDLDCPDIGFSVRVIGSDPHRFDRDGDGYGCESY